MANLLGLTFLLRQLGNNVRAPRIDCSATHPFSHPPSTMAASKFIVLLVGLNLLCLSFASAAGTFADGPAAARAASTLPQISIKGNRFVDPEGNTVVFSGVSFIDT
jgi:hypothetical protein